MALEKLTAMGQLFAGQGEAAVKEREVRHEKGVAKETILV
jgi:hypothetical protein